jgi:hypothetical protein
LEVEVVGLAGGRVAAGGCAAVRRRVGKKGTRRRAHPLEGVPPLEEREGRAAVRRRWRVVAGSSPLGEREGGIGERGWGSKEREEVRSGRGREWNGVQRVRWQLSLPLFTAVRTN